MRLASTHYDIYIQLGDGQMIGRFIAAMDSFAIKIDKYAAFHYAMITMFMYFIVSNSYQIEQRMLNTTI